MTTIDVAQLVAVAFVQAPDRRILQAARADVTTAPAGKTAATPRVRQ